MKTKIIKILSDLVSLRSDVSKTKNEKAVIKYIIDYYFGLPEWKVKKQLVEQDRFNLIVTNSDDPEIVFVGHMDTVPVVNLEQLKPRIDENKLYGRGAVDMKSGLAIMLFLSKLKIKKKVAFVFTVDEEYQFLGMQKFVENNNWQPKLVINPESTNLKILTQCRGFTEINLELEGLSVHAGRKKFGINVIEKTVDFTNILENKLKKLDEKNMTTSLNLASMQAGILSGEKIITRANLVPDFAKTTIELRLASPILIKEKIKQEIVEIVEKVGLKIKKYESYLWFGPLVESKNGLDTFVSSMKNNNINPEFIDPNSSGFYEVQLAQSIWNCPVIIFGVGPTEKSHMIDEYVDLDSLQRAYEVYKDFLLS